MKVKLKEVEEVGGSLNKRLLFVSNYYDYEMCCFKGEISAPKRTIVSKVWRPLSFLLEILSPLWEYKTNSTKNNIKSKIKDLSEK